MTPEARLQEAREAIRRIVAEIARLSRAGLPRQEFFRQFIERCVRAMDAAGGAAWIGRQGRFNLIADVDFESSQYAASSLQRDGIRAALRWVEEHGGPLLIAPMGPDDGGEESASGIPNVTVMPFFYIPLKVGGRVVGVIQIWQRPGRDPRHFRTFTELMLGVAVHAESYLESRQLETAFRETERLEQLLLVSERLLCSGNVQTLAEQVVNLGRDAVGAERLSMLVRRGRRLNVAAIGGVPRVDPRQSLPRSLAAAAEPVAGQAKAQAWRREQLGADEPPPAAVRQLFDESGADLLLMVPLVSGQAALGVLVAEMPGGAASEQDAAMLEGLGRQASAALALFQRGRSGLLRRALGRRLLLGGLVVAAALGALGAIRLPTRIEGRCTVWPIDRAAVASLEPGRVAEVYVSEGQTVQRGAPLVRVENPALDQLLDQQGRELEKWQAEDQRLEAAGDAAGRRIAQIRAARAQRDLDFLRARAATLLVRAPQSGVIVTSDVQQLVGAVVGPEDRIIEIAAPDRWELVVEVPEQEVATLQAVLAGAKGKAVPVQFVLSSRPEQPLTALVTDGQQLSPVARPTGQGNVVLLRAEVSGEGSTKGDLRIGYQGRARILGPEKSLLRMAVDPLANRLRMSFF